MKYRKSMWIPAANCAVLLSALAVSTPVAAQAQTSRHFGTESRYVLKDLGTFGGASSNVNSGSHVINSSGAVVGGADTSDWNPNCDCPVVHAFSWDEGDLTDIGSLPSGGNFSFAVAINSPGTIVGVSANGRIDPTTEIEAFVAATWTKNGGVINLGTFGGSFSLASDINNWGQVVGGAENKIPDPFDFGGGYGLPSPTHWHAALWQKGTKQDLGTLGGPDSFALFVNERGQVAGDSSVDSSATSQGAPAVHAFRWENGRMVDLGTLGGPQASARGLNSRGQVAGTADLLPGVGRWHAVLWTGRTIRDLGTLGADWSEAVALNERGEVAGKSGTAEDTVHAFLWRRGAMEDLRPAAGDGCSVAWGINSKAQVVGQSFLCDESLARASLSENGGPMVDLNTLVPAGSKMFLIEATFINDEGEIAGAGVIPNGDIHAFVLIPKKVKSNAAETVSTIESIASTVVAPGPSATAANHSLLTRQALAALHARLARRQLGLRLPPQW